MEAIITYLTENRLARTNMIYAAMPYHWDPLSRRMREMFNAHLIRRRYIERDVNDIVELDKNGWEIAHARDLIRPKAFELTAKDLREFGHSMGTADSVQSIRIGHAAAGVKFTGYGEIQNRFGIEKITLPYKVKDKVKDKVPDALFVSTYSSDHSIAYALEYESVQKSVWREDLLQRSFRTLAIQCNLIAEQTPYKEHNKLSSMAFPELMFLVVSPRQSRVDKMIRMLEQMKQDKAKRGLKFPLYKRMVFHTLPTKPKVDDPKLRDPKWYPDLFNTPWQGVEGRLFDLRTGKVVQLPTD